MLLRLSGLLLEGQYCILTIEKSQNIGKSKPIRSEMAYLSIPVRMLKKGIIS